MNSAINCFVKILDKAQFDTVVLLHLNTTTDVADNIYTELSTNKSLVWILFNMDNSATLQNQVHKVDTLTKIFSVYVLDVLLDWQRVYDFTISSHLDHRNNHMYVVNKFTSADQLIAVGLSAFRSSFYNCGFLFWNATGQNSELQIFTANGFVRTIYKMKIFNGRCSDNIYDQIFYNKLLNFHGHNLTMYGQTDPPKIVRTTALVNGQYAISLGGHNVLIADTIANHLNVTVRYKLMLRIYFKVYGNESMELQSKFNITHSTHCHIV